MQRTVDHVVPKTTTGSALAVPAEGEALPFASVIIPVLNDPARLKVCLDALQKQTYPADRFEVIVVDNGSAKPIESTIMTSSNCRVITEKKQGSFAARNAGIAVARGSVLAFTDSDCIPNTDWLEKGVAQLLLNPDCGLVAGRVEVFPRVLNDPTGSELYDQLFYLDQEVAVRRQHYGATANLFVFRTIMEKVGRFNSEFKSTGDSEWGKRVYQSGFSQVYANDAAIRHPARSSLRDLIKKTVRITGGHYDMKLARHPGISKRKLLLDDARMWVPPIKNMLWAISGSKAKSTGKAGSRISVAFIVLVLHYCRRLELIRLVLGGVSKNF